MASLHYAIHLEFPEAIVLEIGSSWNLADKPMLRLSFFRG
jgi:hypothetical protein